MMPVVIRSEVREDLDREVRYYSSIRANLAEKFIDDYEFALRRVASDPLLIAIEEGSQARMRLLKRFPKFVMVYVAHDHHIEIVAAVDTMRHPRH